MKLQRKDAGGRESELHPNHPQPKPSSVRSEVECAHQELDSTAINEPARTDHQPSQKSSPARNQPSSNIAERNNKAEIRPEEQSDKTDNFGEKLKGPQRQK